MSGDLESSAGVADFRLIDPPRVSPQPVAPNRLLLLLAALIGAIAVGMVVSLGISQLRPVFHDGRALSSAAGLPLLGVVTLVVSDDVRRKERTDLIKFAAASGSLIGCFVVGIAFLSIMSGRLA